MPFDCAIADIGNLDHYNRETGAYREPARICDRAHVRGIEEFLFARRYAIGAREHHDRRDDDKGKGADGKCGNQNTAGLRTHVSSKML